MKRSDNKFGNTGHRLAIPAVTYQESKPLVSLVEVHHLRSGFIVQLPAIIIGLGQLEEISEFLRGLIAAVVEASHYWGCQWV